MNNGEHFCLEKYRIGGSGIISFIAGFPYFWIDTNHFYRIAFCPYCGTRLE